MEIDQNEKSKILGIWLTGTDRRDAACIARVQALVKEWHGRGWTPVIYQSGSEDMADLTSALLVSNRNRAASRAAGKGSGART